MKKLSETYKELGIDFSFPIEVEDAEGNETYYEDSNGYLCQWEYDTNGNCIHSEDSDGRWHKWEYDTNGNVTYYEDSSYWSKREYDAKGDVTYFEDSYGEKRGTPRSQPCAAARSTS
jgi:YD repeat-containing protein